VAPADRRAEAERDRCIEKLVHLSIDAARRMIMKADQAQEQDRKYKPFTFNLITNENMKEQNYSNHKMLRPFFHFFLFLLVLLIIAGSFIKLWRSYANHEGLFVPSLLAAISIVLIFMFFFMRIFALKAQDRAIRAEENLRHFALTGKLLDPRLNMGQVIALRFAPDEEFVELAQRAASTNMSNDAIKKEIKKWRADHHRA
jgi:hypothetical protein